MTESTKSKSGRSFSGPELSIVIPAYNENQRLPTTLKRVIEYARQGSRPTEVIVVDDGSNDDTADVVSTFAASSRIIRLLQNPINQGKGYSVRRGMMESLGKMTVFTDADLAAPVHEIDKLLAALATGADVAIGVRPTSYGQSLLRRFAGQVFNLVVRVMLGLNFEDTQCGLKGFTREAVNIIFARQTIHRWGFDPEILYIARLHGLKVVPIVVEWHAVPGSKVRVIRDAIRMCAEVLRVRVNGWRGLYDERQNNEL